MQKFRCWGGVKKEDLRDSCAAADIITRYLSNIGPKSGKGRNFWNASDTDTTDPSILFGNQKLTRHMTDLTQCSRATPRLLTSGTSVFVMTGEVIKVAIIKLLFSLNVVKTRRFEGEK
jgi:hypothetical protein